MEEARLHFCSENDILCSDARQVIKHLYCVSKPDFVTTALAALTKLSRKLCKHFVDCLAELPRHLSTVFIYPSHPGLLIYQLNRCSRPTEKLRTKYRFFFFFDLGKIFDNIIIQNMSAIKSMKA